MSSTIDLSQETLQSIGQYLRSNLSTWLQDLGFQRFSERDFELRERTIRVEEELRNFGGLMRQGFSLVEKRFEDVNRHMNRWMTVMIGLIGVAVTVTNLIG